MGTLLLIVVILALLGAGRVAGELLYIGLVVFVILTLVQVLTAPVGGGTILLLIIAILVLRRRRR